jgi:PEP-CTERM motif
MQKRFIAVSIAVATFALAFSFSARCARADSIHLQDLKLDSFNSFSGACEFGCVLDSVFAADRGEIAALFSNEHAEFPVIAQVGWGGGGGAPTGPFGFPTASHKIHREGDGNPGNNAVPEPGSLLLASFGLMGLLLLRKSRSRNTPFPPTAV